MKTYLLLISLLIMLLLASCATPPTEDGALFPVPTTDNARIADEQKLISVLDKANNSLSPETEVYFLEASRLLIGLNRKNEAANILNSINTEQLELPLVAEILLLRSQLHIEQNQVDQALEILNDPRLEAHSQLSTQQQVHYRLIRAQAYRSNNNFLDSVKELIYADRLLNDTAQPEHHEKIWEALNLLPASTLKLNAETEINYEFQGWYALGVIGKAYQYNLDHQLIELERWRKRWTRHPAATHLPQALQLVEAMAQERPDNIALLLPLNTGPGIVIRDSFMSAYFNVRKIGGKVPTVRFYDTSKSNDIKALHRQAREDGAEMIIGPLLKQNVAQLQEDAFLKVPTLALNNVEDHQSKSKLLYQFALSPEEEARQIALKAWGDGHKYASVLSPVDDFGNDFYTRKRNSFIQEWQKLGGQIVAQQTFQNEYTEAIEALLNLSDSEFRKEQLSELIGKSLEFTQRRRQDVDFIFLIAQPGPARQINPRFAYLYAGNIPVYGSQDIYSGTSRPLEDTDLNGILFVDSPWLLAEADEFKSETQTLFPQSSALNLRLQAFGIDAFRLYPRLKQLEDVPNSQIYGATGLLKIDENRHITRELSWAQIEQGEANLLETKK